MKVENYRNWLNTPYKNTCDLTVVITTVTPDKTLNILKDLLEGFAKASNIDYRITVYEDAKVSEELKSFCEEHNLIYYGIKPSESTANAIFGRRDGIQKATTKYITFLDGDDSVLDIVECYSKCIELLETYDSLNRAAFANVNINEDTGAEYPKMLSEDVIEGKVDSNYTIDVATSRSCRKFLYVWDKVYRTSVVKQFEIYDAFGEDTIFNIQCALQNCRLGIVNKVGLIHYFGNDSHLGKTITKKTANSERFNRNRLNLKRFISDYGDKIKSHYSESVRNFYGVLLQKLKDSEEQL